jgi:catechol 2,3-dioxygenase-like lactoylglutathione lyase family enzyme
MSDSIKTALASGCTVRAIPMAVRVAKGWFMQARLSVVGVVVSDMARSLAFYRNLGLETPPGADQEPHVEIELPGGLRLAFDTVETIRSFDSHWSPPSGGHRISLAFAFDTPSGVDQAYEDLVGLGYTGHKEPWDAFWGQRYAEVLDPDGNTVDLCAPLDSGS